MDGGSYAVSLHVQVCIKWNHTPDVGQAVDEDVLEIVRHGGCEEGLMKFSNVRHSLNTTVPQLLCCLNGALE